MPLYDPAYSRKSEMILEYIFTGGNFGYYSALDVRTPMVGSGLRRGLGKIRKVTKYIFTLFPLIPVEATFLYLSRLRGGIVSLAAWPARKPKH